jgi:hypothetical protein
VSDHSSPARAGRLSAGARQSSNAQLGSITFRVGNFKSIESAELTAHRLTVLAGANSSGKSSLLQALLFVGQSVGEPAPVLNGDLVRLGEPRDVIRDGTSRLWFELEYAVNASQPQNDGDVIASFRIEFTEDSGVNNLVVAQISLQVRSEPALSIEAKREPGEGPDTSGPEVLLSPTVTPPNALPSGSLIVVSGFAPRRLIRRADLDVLGLAVDRSITDGMRTSPVIIGQQYARMAQAVGGHDALVEALTVAMTGTRDEAIERLIAVGAEHRDELFEVVRAAEAPGGWVTEAITPNLARSLPQTVGVEEDGEGWRHYVVRHLAAASNRFARLAAAVTYLGPLRDEPRVAYPLGHTVRALPVGESGEFTAAYLQDNATTRMRYTDHDNHVRFGTFPTAVSDWSSYLGIAEAIRVEAKGKLGHQLGLQVAGRERDPTMIGVGASQLLPVIVLVLGAPQGSLVLLEQPELHLHPKVQARLADFLALARPDIRIVVETHSEYLVTRLRRRVVEDLLPLAELMFMFAALIPMEPADESSPSAFTEFRRLEPTELGDFDAWPKDFFDSLDQDSVAIAQAISNRLREAKNSSKG